MENKVELFKAIARFQQEAPVLLKDTDGYGYKYVTFDHIVAQIKPQLLKCNLGFTQLVEGRGLTTIVFHTESGESIEGTAEIPDIDMKGMNKYQSFGAGITYYRRYALSSMLGLLSDKDVDANIYKKDESNSLLVQVNKTEGVINPEVTEVVLDFSKDSNAINNWEGVLKFISGNKDKGIDFIIGKLSNKYKTKAINKNGKEIALKTVVSKNMKNV
jgi:hypothetical protein|tara:strand:+ start:40 stop:687 length:648 start_codon:yes stop_codon:yes gene_type:complete